MMNRVEQPSIEYAKSAFNSIADNDDIKAVRFAKDIATRIEEAKKEKATLKDVPQNKTPIVTAEDIRAEERKANRPLIGDPITKDDDEMVR